MLNIFFILIILCYSHMVAAFETEWNENSHSKVKMIFADLVNNKINAAIEIKIDDGWYIYYKDPGEMGFPTKIINFSSNDFVVHWPEYEVENVKVGDRSSSSNVYKNSVVFPIDFSTPLDKVNLEIDYAVCKDVCIPIKANISVNLPDNFKVDLDSKEVITKWKKKAIMVSTNSR